MQQSSQNYFTPCQDVPRRRKSGLEELVEMLVERNALYSCASSFALAAPIVFALGAAIAFRI